jgi:hypothetical protein
MILALNLLELQVHELVVVRLYESKIRLHEKYKQHTTANSYANKKIPNKCLGFFFISIFFTAFL